MAQGAVCCTKNKKGDVAGEYPGVFIGNVFGGRFQLTYLGGKIGKSEGLYTWPFKLTQNMVQKNNDKIKRPR